MAAAAAVVGAGMASCGCPAPRVRLVWLCPCSSRQLLGCAAVLTQPTWDMYVVAACKDGAVAAASSRAWDHSMHSAVVRQVYQLHNMSCG
jgi:hypothetical protein